jgi:hypothetical protein
MKYSALLLYMMPVLILQASEDSKPSVIVSIYRLHNSHEMYETTYRMYHVENMLLGDVQKHIEGKFNVQGMISVHDDHRVVSNVTDKSPMDGLLRTYGVPCKIDFTILPFPTTI